MTRIIIDKVANGWIVTEAKEPNPFEDMNAILNGSEIQQMQKQAKKDCIENVFIYPDFIEVLKHLEKYV